MMWRLYLHLSEMQGASRSLDPYSPNGDSR
nr:MAG TPA: hypothetical protein [Caudoviricetes sp.]DAN20328.1 MAG TPA: hypothetical protein [Caudoviricetes sp.]DAS08441.1 MAG TPA: hypothetical protein [Caudoviricetes sp.]